MLPGYGFTPFPDFHPHLHTFRCRGENPSMWIPGTGESHGQSESKEGRPLLHPIHHKHVAVCQQETLAFIELQQPAPSKLNGLGSQRQSTVSDSHSQPLSCLRQTLNELNDMQRGNHRTDAEHTINVSSPSHDVGDLDVVCQNSTRTSLQDQTEKPRTITTVCRPLHAALSLPLSFPLSSLYTSRDTWESQVYSPDSPSDESISSPILEADYIFPGPFASFLEEDLSELSSLDATSTPSSTDGAPDLPNISHEDSFYVPSEPLQIIEDSEPGAEEESEIVETLLHPGVSFLPRSRQTDQERRRFSASELISRLQLSQRKNSFTLKLGKSLSARVASRDRQNSNSLSPNPDSILYQEYSDVAINREIQRQQGKDPGTEEEGLRDEGSDGTPSPSNLSPSSSFRSSRGSAFALWQDIPDVRTSGQLDTFSNEERKLQEAKFELVTSEASYIRSLTIAVDHFMLSQELAECLGAQEKQWLFSKMPEVKDVSERFLQDLEHRLEEDILRFDVCDIVLDHCPALRRVYLPYVTNQAYQEQTYQRLLQENPRFPGILARLEEDPICQRLPLTSFLILPFQRITRLKMLVENILKRTTPGSRDEDTATKAFNELKKVIIRECNSSVQSMKRMEELIHLNKKIHFEGKIFPLISQSRWLVKHGELLEVDTQMMSISGSKLKLPTKPVYLHLFNDCLLLSRRKELAQIDCMQHTLRHKPNISQVQCIKSYQAQEHDELTLEKADILHAKTITSDGWVEGIRLSDGERGWFPKTYVEEITSRSARLRNLRENIRIKCVTQKLKGDN
ncbi:Rho guanine nucleotide exchange factor 19 [Goodea atripinnis]|uniref:Rho guanine nucleotide exchange factor 19 n=1 Tax=Goodea atripinnis TaxID=208336 RepID=A0ABV0MDS6_9TELE